MAKKVKELSKKIKKKVDQKLDIFFKKEIKKASEVDKIYKEALNLISDFTLRGGKRIRASLMYYGYIAAGGKKTTEILNASLSMELVHTFALIQDDIVDNDVLRRGSLTLHKQYEKMFWNLKINDPERLGKSFAILCGDVAYSLANQVLCDCKFEDKLKIRALKKCQEMINNTVAGEMLDIACDLKKDINTEDVLKIYKYKTAMYTLDGPLIIGCILAGGSEKIKEMLSNYAVYLGVAFQIHDDVIGIFGHEHEIGKQVGSDIREGKKTLIILSALERSKKEDRKYFKKQLGNKKLSKKELEKCRTIIQECGAFKYSMGIANNLSVKAKELIVNSGIRGVARDFLLESADYLIERKR